MVATFLFLLCRGDHVRLFEYRTLFKNRLMESDDPHQSRFRQFRDSKRHQFSPNIQLPTNQVVVDIGAWTKEQVSNLAESVRDIHLPDMSTKLELPLQNFLSLRGSLLLRKTMWNISSILIVIW
jgi:hypothetical protein